MIFIPVHNPNSELLKLVIKLIKIHSIKAYHIYIVNDHSKNQKSNKIFLNLSKLGCNIKSNKFSKGKGSAIKYSLNYARDKKLKYILFADGDGQHTDVDIINIYSLGKKNKNFFIGQRSFENAPALNRISNNFSNYLFNLITRLNLKDTQCGLRFIPDDCYDIIIEISENQFDLELASLFEINKNKKKIKPVNIQTIYFNTKYISNYNKIFDSLRIFKIFLIYKFFMK